MNVYKITFCVPYGKHICIVVANNGINALDLALYKLHAVHQTFYNNEDIDKNVEELPLLSKNDKEEVIFIDGYEE